MSTAVSRIRRDGLKRGESAPPFQLPLVPNGDITLSRYRERHLLLVFSDPNCGPCNALLPDLEALHRRTPDINILMVSRGSIEENHCKIRDQNVTFPVALQRHWEVSTLYAMFATPMAYLIGPDGLIAADVAVGGPAVLGLLKAGAIKCLIG